MHKTIVFLIVCFSLPLMVQAEIYKTIDAQGNVSFSDKATKNSEAVELKPIITYSPQPSTRRTQFKRKKKNIIDAYQVLNLISPSDQQTIRSQLGEVTIAFNSVPALRMEERHYYQILVNGVVFIKSLTQTRFMLRGIERGEHRIQVRVLDYEGKVLVQSMERTFHLKRHSIRY